MWTPESIGELREELGESRKVFALRFRKATGTIRNWEQGINAPGGSDEVILDQAKAELESRKQPA